MKSAASLRTAYYLRSQGYEVRTVNHFTVFTQPELETIIDGFASGEKIICCLSTSFLRRAHNLREKRFQAFKKGTDNKGNFVETNPSPDEGTHWGSGMFEIICDLLKYCKSRGHIVVVGGFEIHNSFFANERIAKAMGLQTLVNYVDYFIEGKNITILPTIAEGSRMTLPLVINKIPIYKTGDLLDFTDAASTPTNSDIVFMGESLPTELSTGCIFSCHYCNYGTLGKKKNEYVRSYESVKQEFVDNYNNFRVSNYMLTDNIVNDYLEKLHWLIRIKEETGIDIRWTGYIRADTIKSKEHAQLIADSGASSVVMGIESFTKTAGPPVGKMTDKDKLVKSLTFFREAVGDNCLAHASLIAGLPTESIDQIRQNTEWLESSDGKYLIDSYLYTALRIFLPNDNKNDINKARNNPFSDYEVDPALKGIVWKSPWGTSTEFMELASELNKSYKNDERVRPGGFSVPFFVSAGIDIDRVIKVARHGLYKNESVKVALKDEFFSKASYKRNLYKKELLRRSQNEC